MWLLPPIPEPIIVIHDGDNEEDGSEAESESEQRVEVIEETRLLSVEETRSSRTEACLRVRCIRRELVST